MTRYNHTNGATITIKGSTITITDGKGGSITITASAKAQDEMARIAIAHGYTTR